MKCPKCNTEILDDSIFCSACGQKIDEWVGEEVVEEVITPPVESIDEPTDITAENSSPESDAEVTEPLVNSQPEATATEEVIPVDKASGSKFTKKHIFILAGIVAVVLIVILVTSLFGSNNSANYTLYLRDHEIFIHDYSENNPIELTSDLLNSDDSIEASEYSNVSDALAVLTMRSEDGTKILFPDKIDGDEGFVLYYYDVTKPEEEPIKIDSDVGLYGVNKDFDQVVYYKINNSSLYRHDMENKEKLASDVWDFTFSSDLSTIFYENEDSDLYCLQADGSKEKVDSEIYSITSIMNGYLYYEKEDNLYKYSVETGKEKVASNIYRTYQTNDLGSVVIDIPTNGLYYYSDPYLPVLDFIKNDIEASTGWESFFEDSEVYVGYTDLTYYDGENKFTLSSAAQVLDSYSTNDKSIICYRNYDLKDGEVGLAEIDEQYYLHDLDFDDLAKTLINEKLEASSEYCCAINGVVYTIAADSISYLNIDPSNSRIYYVDTSEYEDSKGDLYYCVITDDGLEEPVLLDNDITDTHVATKTGYVGLPSSQDNTKLVYFKDGDNSTGDIYADGQVLDYEVLIDSVRYDNKTNTFYYLTNWDSNDLCGSLSMYNESGRVKIADDVNCFTIAQDGSILYLADLSTKSYRGDLYRYHKDEATLLDNDVYDIFNAHTPAELPLALLG